jgi:transposase
MEVFPLGIDIPKAKFDVALLRDEGKLRHKVFPNTGAGFQQLSAWLSKHNLFSLHACMEATGNYGEALAMYLYKASHRVSVINPSIIKAFAKTELSRTKTDKRDASLIARYCLQHRPPEWAPPSEIGELQPLLRRLEALFDMRQQETDRLEAGISASSVKKSVTDPGARLLTYSIRPEEIHPMGHI